jgi:hypothetical protein
VIVAADRAREEADPVARKLLRIAPVEVADDVLDEAVVRELTAVPGIGIGDLLLARQLIEKRGEGVAGSRHRAPKARLHPPPGPLRQGRHTRRAAIATRGCR